jgi:hypothetical protein
MSTEATLILVEVQTDAGLRGYGEIQSGPLPLVCRLVEQFGEIIRGMDALAHLEVWGKLFALTSPRPGWMRGQDELPPPLSRGQRPQIMAALGVRVEHPGGQVWTVRGNRDTVLATSTWGTSRYPAPSLAQAILEQRRIDSLPIRVHADRFLDHSLDEKIPHRLFENPGVIDSTTNFVEHPRLVAPLGQQRMRPRLQVL